MGITERIGMIGALPEEIKGLRAQMQIEAEETVSGVCFTKGLLCGRQVVVCVCGVGKVNAALAAEAMLLRYGVTALINTGVAGGLAPGLCVGDVVIAESVVQHDMNTIAFGDPQGLLPGLDRVHLEADPALRAALLDAAKKEGCNARAGVIASGDLFVAKEKTKAGLRAAFGADACEMEGAAVGLVAHANGVPFAVLRCISDGGDHMEYNRFVQLAADISTRITLRFLATR